MVTLLMIIPTTAMSSHTRGWSTAGGGTYAHGPVLTENFTASDGTTISYAVFLPALAPGERVPVILTAGPYFEISEPPVNVPSPYRLSGFLIDNFVPHGYAVVAASVRGTGWSGGCMEMGSLREVQDIDELVSYLAGQSWSSGSVGITGKSYDGAVAFAVASLANPALKTAMPIAGLSDWADAFVHNGVGEETRVVTHYGVQYYPYGFGMDGTYMGGSRSTEHRAGNLACPELVQGTGASVLGALGDDSAAPYFSDYYAERRYRDNILAHYEGSMFIVHGLQDFNVDPHQIAPFFAQLHQDKKLLLGQWRHEYPDQVGVATKRNDFGAMSLAWFDKYLKGEDTNTGPVAQVADARTRQWHTYADWPAPEAVRTLYLDGGNRLADAPPAPFQKVVANTADGMPYPDVCGSPTIYDTTVRQRFKWTTDETFVLSGVPEVDLVFDPATYGNLNLLLCADGQAVTHGWGAMHHAQGGYGTQVYVPGLPVTLHTSLEPVERTVYAGQKLDLYVWTNGCMCDDAELGSWDYDPGRAHILAGGALRLPMN